MNFLRPFGRNTLKNLTFQTLSFLCPKPTTKPKIAIYARVSTKDKQDVQNQLRELRRWAKKMGYKIYKEYIDNEK
ncbi:recombinase family protein [candidate division KSB1 bacterium]|nr:recombinase family protein [candidate division KSB1 bacterium]